MYRQTVFYPDTPGPRVPIDHTKVCDGFAQLASSKFYRDRDATCGICGRDFILGALAQKEILEQNGVPVKFLDRGAAFCGTCLPIRRRIKALERWRASLLREMSIPADTEQQLRAALEARCALLENFGEGDPQLGLRALDHAARRLPEASFGDLRVRLLLLHRNRASGVEHRAANELAALREQERGLRATAQRGPERETVYPCD
jgi:hypothetical protein